MWITVPTAQGMRPVEATWREALRHLDDLMHPWGDTTMVERLQGLGVCLPGFADNPRELSVLHAAYDLIEEERTCSTYRVLPGGAGTLAERADVLDAFAVIRVAFKMREAREMKNFVPEG